jgi:hypothetical protein
MKPRRVKGETKNRRHQQKKDLCCPTRQMSLKLNQLLCDFLTFRYYTFDMSPLHCCQWFQYSWCMWQNYNKWLKMKVKHTGSETFMSMHWRSTRALDSRVLREEKRREKRTEEGIKIHTSHSAHCRISVRWRERWAKAMHRSKWRRQNSRGTCMPHTTRQQANHTHLQTEW